MAKSSKISCIFLLFLVLPLFDTLTTSLASKLKKSKKSHQSTRPPYKVSLYFNADYESLKGSQICQIPGEQIDRLYFGYLVYSAGVCKFSKFDSESYLGPTDAVCGNPPQSSTETYFGDIYQLQKFKLRYPNVKLFLSLGGPYYSNAVNLHNFMVSSPASIVSACMPIFNKYKSIFDGIDLDLEFPCVSTDSKCGPNGQYYLPSSNDKSFFTTFVTQLKAQLASAPLSLLVSSDTNKLNSIDFTAIDSYIDHYNIKDYDITSGSFGDTTTGFHSFIGPILNDPVVARSTQGATQGYRFLMGKAINPMKINLGSPFYGRGFQVPIGTVDSTNGFMPATGGLKNAKYENNVWDYKDIKSSLLTPNPQNVFYNLAGLASYYYDSASGTFISYESTRSATEKVKFVKRNGMQGVFAWEFSGDSADHELLINLNQNPAI